MPTPALQPAAAGARRTVSRRRRRTAFTFTEVMFAVVILGIGFVMIAAILPVAIQQTKTSADETTATAAGQAMIAALTVDQAANQKLFSASYNHATPDRPAAEFFGDPNNGTSPGTGADLNMHYTVAQQWSAIRGSLIWQQDTRFGCVPIYIRGRTAVAPITSDPVATLIVIVTQCHAGDSPNKSDPNRYDSNDLIFTTPGPPVTPATLQPKHLTAVFNASSPGQPQSVTFTGAVTGDVSCVGEGCFVVIAASDPTSTRPQAVGNIVRLGPIVNAATNTWSLNSDFDMTAMPASDRPDGKPYDVYVVGKSLTNPAAAFDAVTNPYAGAVHDLAVFKTLVPVH